MASLKGGPRKTGARKVNESLARRGTWAGWLGDPEQWPAETRVSTAPFAPSRHHPSSIHLATLHTEVTAATPARLLSCSLTDWRLLFCSRPCEQEVYI